jgi:Sulfotransferase family
MQTTGPSTPIFLLCSERSGSNLIAAMMGGHSKVFAHPPYHLGRDLILNLHEVLAGGTTSKAWSVLCQHAVAKVAEYRSQDEADRLQVWLNAQGLIDAERIARYIWLEMPQAPGATHVFVKENNLQHLLPFLIAKFPEAKFVFQVRDPRDYLASAMARKAGSLGNKFGSIRQAMAVWREDQLAGLRALALLGSERVHFLRYEDLVSDGARRLADLCTFVGLSFESEMLSFHETDAAQRLAVAGGPRENLAKPLMTKNFRKYLTALSKSQIRTIEAYVGDVMEVLGYDLDFGRATRHSAWRAFWPIVTEPFERLANAELRPHYKVGHKRLIDALDDARQPISPSLKPAAENLKAVT